MKIRKLTRGDRKKLTSMIKALAVKIGSSQLLNIISPEAKGEGETGNGDAIEKIGIEVFKTMLEHLESDLCEWLADLVGVTVEEFDDLPFNAELDIISQIADAEEFADFFTQASQLRNRVESFAGLFKKQNVA
jgi:hypothetical protein